MSSFIAAGTAYATHGINTIPFFIYYSMFGFQRVGDLIWAAADSRARGFLLGGTAGRTTLAGEGLQHQDGHSHVCSLSVPNCISYDPAFAYELAVIIQDGIRRMYRESGEHLLLPDRDERAVRRCRRCPKARARASSRACTASARRANAKAKLKAQLLGSGAILNEVLAAQKLLEKYGVAADVWSVTSYQELYRDGHACERWNMLHPAETPRVPYVDAVLQGRAGRHRRGVRLPEGAAGLDRPLAAAPRALARHRRLRPQRGSRRVCATSSKSTRASSRSRRSPSWRSDGQIDAKRRRSRRSRISASTPRRRIRRRRNR